MKKLLLVAILLSCIASVAEAKQCDKHVISWEPSASANVEYYTVYNGDNPLGDTPGLTYEKNCELSDISVTATNKYGIESDRSVHIIVEKPEPPTSSKIIVRVTVDINL